MQTKEEHTISKEISNNVMVLILIIIIFVSLLGTLIVKQAIDDFKTAKAQTTATQISTGMGAVSLTILPSEKKNGEKEK